MRAPAFAVLFAALVCSIFGTASEQSADHGTTSILNSILHNHRNMHDDIAMGDHINNVKFVTNNDLNNDLKVIKDIEVNKNKVSNRDKYSLEAIDTADNIQMRNLDLHRQFIEKRNKALNSRKVIEMNDVRHFEPYKPQVYKRSKRVKRNNEENCEPFDFHPGKDQTQIFHPKAPNSKTGLYANSTDCVSVINGTEGQVIQLTFVDMFHIEYHPDCAYDYLEIRDGIHGYAHLLANLCGEVFPLQVTSTGPSLWLKFHSDDTIEYEGFHINIKFESSPSSHSIPDTCYKTLEGMHGSIDTAAIDQDCLSRSSSQALDVLWTIKAVEGTKIYLNFTTYQLAKPNECEDNVVQVFGSVLEFPARLAHYCGSMANPVTTKGGEAGAEDKGNIMYVRLYASKAAKGSFFNAMFTAFRTLDPNKDEKCSDEEFDCEDNTCIAKELKCNGYANCRLKADEDAELCKGETESMISQPHIMVILIIFSLILSGMSFVFLFKCIRKLYQDHKLIKEHIRQSCEDRLDTLVSSRLTLDPNKLRLDSEPRASLERENHANEMFKRQRNYSQHKPTSIDSDIQETQIDDEEECRHYLKHSPIEEEVRIERNGRRHSSSQDKAEKKEDKKREKQREIRDASVGAPDTKESGCQTRESLFQAGAPSSDESGSGSRGFSTFGYSGATLVRPSPPAPTATSEFKIELLRTTPHQDSLSKKLPERRPMSTETTRSAPDVIIVSKPIR